MLSINIIRSFFILKATRCKWPALIELLITLGVNINEQDEEGWTALHEGFSKNNNLQFIITYSDYISSK